MCLAIPAKITKLKDTMLAEVEIGGVMKDVSLMLLPEVQVGDYVLIHTGFAIEKIDEKEAEETMKLLKQMIGEEE
jgi:hydrogenase expression/formation protein HypC